MEKEVNSESEKDILCRLGLVSLAPNPLLLLLFPTIFSAPRVHTAQHHPICHRRIHKVSLRHRQRNRPMSSTAADANHGMVPMNLVSKCRFVIGSSVVAYIHTQLPTASGYDSKCNKSYTKPQSTHTILSPQPNSVDLTPCRAPKLAQETSLYLLRSVDVSTHRCRPRGSEFIGAHKFSSKTNRVEDERLFSHWRIACGR
jgi:hypothetical protein